MHDFAILMESQKMPNPQYAVYKDAELYFNLVRGALGDLVDGEHFFDIVADNVIYEVLYNIAGWPQTIRGRADLMAQFRGNCDNVAPSPSQKFYRVMTTRLFECHFPKPIRTHVHLYGPHHTVATFALVHSLH
jgi:hypothetical protein